MSEEMLLNELLKLGWTKISKSSGLIIYSFELGIRHCMLDLINDRIYPYTNAMEPTYLTPEEASIFVQLSQILHKEESHED